MDAPAQPEKSPGQDEKFGREYFEYGLVTGVSNYMNYSWMPEMTLRMAHHLVRELGIEADDRILDFGCAKGFLVKAFRILDFEAYGVDVSAYAIASADGAAREFCARVEGCDDANLFARDYDWMIAKDVFEHIEEEELRPFLPRAAGRVKNLFAVVPVAPDDSSGRYVIPEYDRDATHVIAKSVAWWRALFEEGGWRVARESLRFTGCKENWTANWPDGNAFFVLARAGG